MEQVKRYELKVSYPVRIVQKENGIKYICGTDLARLFGYKKPYDAVKKDAKGLEKILIPCKQSPENNSRTLCFLSEFQACCYIMKQLERKKLTTQEDNEYQSYVFLSSIEAGLMPEILNPKAVSVQQSRKQESSSGTARTVAMFIPFFKIIESQSNIMDSMINGVVKIATATA